MRYNRKRQDFFQTLSFMEFKQCLKLRHDFVKSLSRAAFYLAGTQALERLRHKLWPVEAQQGLQQLFLAPPLISANPQTQAKIQKSKPAAKTVVTGVGGPRLRDEAQSWAYRWPKRPARAGACVRAGKRAARVRARAHACLPACLPGSFTSLPWISKYGSPSRI